MGSVAEQEQIILVASERNAAENTATSQLVSHSLKSNVSRLRCQILRHGSEVVLIFIEVRAVIFPVIPNGERGPIEQVCKLLPCDVSGLDLERNALGVGRITPLAAQDGDLFFRRGGRITLNQLEQFLIILRRGFRRLA